MERKVGWYFIASQAPSRPGLLGMRSNHIRAAGHPAHGLQGHPPAAGLRPLQSRGGPAAACGRCSSGSLLGLCGAAWRPCTDGALTSTMSRGAQEQKTALSWIWPALCCAPRRPCVWSQCACIKTQLDACKPGTGWERQPAEHAPHRLPGTQARAELPGRHSSKGGPSPPLGAPAELEVDEGGEEDEPAGAGESHNQRPVQNLLGRGHAAQHLNERRKRR